MSLIRIINEAGMRWLNEADVCAWFIDQAIQLEQIAADDEDAETILVVAAQLRDLANNLLDMGMTR